MSLFTQAIDSLLLGVGGLAALAVGPDGEVLGFTQAARELLGIDAATEAPRRFAELFDTEDQATGMRSFLESGPGKATFTGR